MNYYETLYIVHPVLESGRLKDIIMAVEDSLKKMGGDLLAIELWGKRKLAYFIDKQKYGTYVLIQYNGEGQCTHNFAIELEHNPNILAHLTTSIAQDDVIEQEDDLETQIAGKTREAERGGLDKKRNNNKDSTISTAKLQGDSPAEVLNKEESSDSGDKQTDSDIKNDESAKVLSKKNDSDKEGSPNLLIEDSDNNQADVLSGSKTIDENKSTEETLLEEKVSESDQGQAEESTAINEKE